MIPADRRRARWAPSTCCATRSSCEMVDEQNVLRLSREALADVRPGDRRRSPPARCSRAGAGCPASTSTSTAGDLSPACDVATDPLCDGGGYNNYTVEVVDRMGTDSFTPDSGVLLAKTKNQDRAPFEWVVDANPQDIDMTDYVLPDGTKVPITIGDYRQLVRRAVPRRHRLRQRVRVRRRGQPAALLRPRPQARPRAARCPTRSRSARSTAPARRSAASRCCPTAPGRPARTGPLQAPADQHRTPRPPAGDHPEDVSATSTPTSTGSRPGAGRAGPPSCPTGSPRPATGRPRRSRSTPATTSRAPGRPGSGSPRARRAIPTRSPRRPAGCGCGELRGELRAARPGSRARRGRAPGRVRGTCHAR